MAIIAVFYPTVANRKSKGAMSYLDPKSSFFRVFFAACILLTSVAYADEYADINSLIRSEKLTEAMLKVDAYLLAKPRDPQMRFLKGVIQRNSGKPAEAISTFTKLTEDYPELPEPYNNLAVLYAGQSQFEKARSALEMAIRTNPSYATAHENLGGVYARLASQAYGTALQLEGSNTAVVPKLALIKEVFKPNIKAQPNANVAPAASATVAALNAPLPVPLPVKAFPSIPVTAGTAPIPAAVAAAAASNVMSAVQKPAAQPKSTVDKLNKDVEVAVLSWAKAWSEKDMNTYLGAYAKEFTPPGNQTRAVWEQERRKRITEKSNIIININNISISINENKASAKFRQDYKASALTISSRKTLSLIKLGDQWLIVKESTGN